MNENIKNEEIIEAERRAIKIADRHKERMVIAALEAEKEKAKEEIRLSQVKLQAAVIMAENSRENVVEDAMKSVDAFQRIKK